MSNCYIIAEAGVNHNGSLELALKLVDMAVASGADAVKFQTFNASALATSNAGMAKYQIKNSNTIDDSMLRMLEKLELSREVWHKIYDHCRDVGIEFLSTPFDVDSLNFLVDDLGLGTIKIGSGDLNNSHLLIESARKQVSIILSTGMGDIGDIQDALCILFYGYQNERYPKSFKEMKDFFYSSSPWPVLNDKVSILHCVSNYPTNPDEVNLRCINTLKKAFNLNTGFSDHTLGIEVAIAAVALGSKIIEKHITVDKNLSGPDHKCSLEFKELLSLVQSIRNVEKALGSGRKGPVPAEVEMAKKACRSVVANREIKRGSVITAQDLAVKRPSSGVSPKFFWDIIGSSSGQDYSVDECISQFFVGR